MMSARRLASVRLSMLWMPLVKYLYVDGSLCIILLIYIFSLCLILDFIIQTYFTYSFTDIVWLVDPQPTHFLQSGHMSTIDQGRSASQKPTSWPLSHGPPKWCRLDGEILLLPVCVFHVENPCLHYIYIYIYIYIYTVYFFAANNIQSYIKFCQRYVRVL